MKTARFSEIVQHCGRPEAHLVLIEPRQDKALQAAIKAHRVLTVLQTNVGTKADSAVVGFEAGNSRQYLIFPKSLRRFAGRKIVGIKYELLSTKELPPRERATPPKPPKTARPKRPSKKKAPQPKAPAHSKKVIPFPSTAEKKEDPKEISLQEIRHLARQAMNALKSGKQVVAFELLKKIALA